MLSLPADKSSVAPSWVDGLQQQLANDAKSAAHILAFVAVQPYLLLKSLRREPISTTTVTRLSNFVHESKLLQDSSAARTTRIAHGKTARDVSSLSQPAILTSVTFVDGRHRKKGTGQQADVRCTGSRRLRSNNRKMMVPSLAS
ncbi:hypothetical protein LTR27_006176 [Elasticomyces elasticus]|nr:hypothetical protein LTR27_006176 [Elasticomyces elasticus]